MEAVDFVCNYSPEDLAVLEELLIKNNELIEEFLEKFDIIFELGSITNSILYILIVSLAGVGFIYLMYKFLKIFI